MSCTDVRLSLGAYVLGALDPPERSAVEAHLESCPACRDEVAEFAGLPGLLGHLTAAEAEAGAPEPSPGLLDRLLAEVADESADAAAARGRVVRRRRWLAAVAAAAVVAGGATTAVLTLDHPGPKGVVAASAADPRTHVAADVRLRPVAWGSEVDLRLSGVPAGEHCSLVVVAGDGHRENGGSWAASYQGTASVTGTVSVAPADVRRVEVVTFAGRTLVSVPVAAGSAGNAAPAGSAATWR